VTSGPPAARVTLPVARPVRRVARRRAELAGRAGLQALAAGIGGRSARGIVFALSLLNLAAFAGTGLLAHRLARGRRDRQMRAALLWTVNPLLLQVLVAGAHVDGLAVCLAVSALALLSLSLRYAPRVSLSLRYAPRVSLSLRYAPRVFFRCITLPARPSTRPNRRPCQPRNPAHPSYPHPVGHCVPS
jgi:hypothetical protein